MSTFTSKFVRAGSYNRGSGFLLSLYRDGTVLLLGLPCMRATAGGNSSLLWLGVVGQMAV